MKLLQSLLFLFASIAAALIMSRGAAGTHAIPAHLLRGGSVEGDAGLTEREEEAAYPHRRVLYDNRYITYNGVQANNAACQGSCPGRGQPYTGGGCQARYGCRGR